MTIRYNTKNFVYFFLLWCLLIYNSSFAIGNNPFIIGVCTHLVVGDKPIQASIDKISSAGIQSLRDDAFWGYVEQQPNDLKIPESWDLLVNISNSHGIKPLLILGYGNKYYDNGDKPITPEAIYAFKKYAVFVAKHFKGRVGYYEIWNEWDHNTGKTSPGSAESYVKLVSSVYPELKKTDPNAIVLAGGMTSEGIQKNFLKKILQLGLLNFTDALSIHTYIHCRKDHTPENWASWMQDVEEEIKQVSGKFVPFYITEMGWPAYTGKCGISVEDQGSYLLRMFVLAKTMPFIKGIWWYDLQNDGVDPRQGEHNFGLLDSKLNPKPAYLNLKEVSYLIGNAEYVNQAITDGSVKGYLFGTNTQDWLVVWPLKSCKNIQLLSSKKVDLKVNDPASITQPLIWHEIYSRNKLLETNIKALPAPQLFIAPAKSLLGLKLEINCES